MFLKSGVDAEEEFLKPTVDGLEETYDEFCEGVILNATCVRHDRKLGLAASLHTGRSSQFIHEMGRVSP